MPRCTFCKQNYEFPRGLTVFLNDGASLFFCSSKCRKNFALKRDNKKVKWIIRSKKGRKEQVEKKEFL